MSFRRAIAIFLALSLAAGPAMASVMKAVAPKPVRLPAPALTLAAELTRSLGTLKISLAAPGFAGARGVGADPQLAVAIIERVQALAAEHPSTIVSNHVIGGGKARADSQLAVATVGRGQVLTAKRRGSASSRRDPEDEEPPAADPEEARAMLERVNGVFSDYVDDVRDMPEEELAALSMAVLEQGRAWAPGYYSAPALAQRRAGRLVAASGMFAEVSGGVYRHYTDREGLRGILPMATLRAGDTPHARLTDVTGVFLTGRDKTPAEAGVEPGKNFYVDVLVPLGTPVLKIEGDDTFVIPLPGQSKAEIHARVEIVGAGRLSEPAQELPLGGIHVVNGRAYHGEEPLSSPDRRGRGNVFVHPSDNGALVEVGVGGLESSPSFASGKEVADGDYRMSLAVADAGAGPEVLGYGRVRDEPGAFKKWLWARAGKTPKAGSRPALVKRRIFGRDVQDLIRERAFGEYEYRLVHEMLDRLAAAGLNPSALRLENIRIGSTAADPEVKAYLLDGGALTDARGVADLRAELNTMLARSKIMRGAGRLERAVGRQRFRAAFTPGSDGVELILIATGLDRFFQRLTSFLPGDIIAETMTPFAWSRAKRYGIIAAIIGVLAFLPGLVTAVPVRAVVTPIIEAGGIHGLLVPHLGVFPSWPVLIAGAAVLAWAGLPLRKFVWKLAPWELNWMPRKGRVTPKNMAMVAPLVTFAAIVEELAFRGVFLAHALVHLIPYVPPLPAFALASVAISLVFSLIHGFGPIWPRVVGGMIYSAAFAMTGSLSFVILAHLILNATLFTKLIVSPSRSVK